MRWSFRRKKKEYEYITPSFINERYNFIIDMLSGKWREEDNVCIYCRDNEVEELKKKFKKLNEC